MNCFEEISMVEAIEDINGGGILSCIAGGMAGAIVGTFVGIVPAAATGNAKYIKQSVIAGTSAGVWVGAGCPLP